MQKSGWRNSQDGIKKLGYFFSSVVLFIFGATYIFPFFYFPSLVRPVLLIGALLIIYILTDASYRNNVNCVANVYFVEVRDATQIVENVLNVKQFPFRREDNGESVHYYLDKDDVEMIISPFSPNVRIFSIGSTRIASLIKIRSTDVENDLLVQNLKRKLDDGFAPQGL